MQYFPGRHNRIYYMIEELKDFVASRVKINEASLDPHHPRDFIDCFLIKMHQVRAPLAQYSSLTPPGTCNLKPICRGWGKMASTPPAHASCLSVDGIQKLKRETLTTCKLFKLMKSNLFIFVDMHFLHVLVGDH